MKGHIEPAGTKKNHWSIVLEVGRTSTGSRSRRRYAFHGTKREAESELTRRIHEFETGQYMERDRLLVKEYLLRWLSDYAVPRTATRTHQRYQEIIEKHLNPALGNHKLTALRPLHIQSYYTKAMDSGRLDGKGGLSARTVLHHHRVLSEALKQAVKWQLLIRNPADAVQAPRPVSIEMQVLSEDESADLLLAAENTILYLPVLLALTTGMRRGEVLGLRWQDVGLDAEKLVVQQSLEEIRGGLNFKRPKTEKSRRTLPLPALVASELRRHLEAQKETAKDLGAMYQDNGLVFCREDGRPWSPGGFSREFAELVRVTKIPKVRFHDLRHTHATQLFGQNVHPKMVSERLGHSTVGITLNTYTHVIPGMQEEVSVMVGTQMNQALERALNRRGTGKNGHRLGTDSPEE